MANEPASRSLPCPKCRVPGLQPGADRRITCPACGWTSALTGAEVLHHLINFVVDPEDVLDMTDAEVTAHLRAEGMDVDARMAEFREQMAGLRREREAQELREETNAHR